MQLHYFEPMLAMLALTSTVFLFAVKDRIAEIKEKRISPQALARAKDTTALLENLKAMDNFNNLLQVPILFYVLCLGLVITGPAHNGFYIAAWLYVIMRCAHSAIQVGYNRVILRFYVWILSTMLLFFSWVAFAIYLYGLHS